MIAKETIQKAEAKQQTMFNLSNKRTGYSIYNGEAKRRIKQNTLPSLYPKLPNKKFDIINADPQIGRAHV